MGTLGYSTNCKVKLCFQHVQYQGITEFYCNTCKHDLCHLCKVLHVLNLETKRHDVVIYREKYDYVRHITCATHPDRMYEMFCHSCKLPFCLLCNEHREHETEDITTAYKINRQQIKKIIEHIRTESFYTSCCILVEIKNDVKAFHSEISNRERELSTKAQNIMHLFNNAICDVKTRYEWHLMQRLQRQVRRMRRCLDKLEYFEYKYEQTANRPLNFLLFIKKSRVHKILCSPILTQRTLLSLTKNINNEDVGKLGEIHNTETGNREVRNELQYKMMSICKISKCLTAPGVIGVNHLSCVTSHRIWISDYWSNELFLTNTAGDTLHHLTDKVTGWGVHTVNGAGDLIYVDRDHNIMKLSADNKTKSCLIKTTNNLRPWCVHSSPYNGDILVLINKYDKCSLTINRYDKTGQHIQTMPHDNRGQIVYIYYRNVTGVEWYKYPVFLTENRNGDIIVCDIDSLIVKDRAGNHRFTYTGPPSGLELSPRGICTDAFSHIIVCDTYTRTIQMIDKDGRFIASFHTQKQGIIKPFALSYDFDDQLLWVGCFNSKNICAYRYINRHI